MQHDDQAFPAGRGWLWTGRVLSTLAILLFVLDGVMKLVKPAAVVIGSQRMGFPESEIVGTGITLLICTALYSIPRTSLLGAVLLTGYLGGAIAAQVRIQAPLSEVCPVVVFAALVWGGLWLRNPRLRAMLPLQR